MEASNDAAISSPSVDPSTTTEITAALTSPPLSKSAQKRMLKEARRQEHKLEKRARERELKKEKKRIRAEKRAAGEELVEDENPRKKQRTGKKKPFKARVVVDLGFDDKMQPKEIHSLCSQLNYTYSCNRRAFIPFESLLFTSLNGATKDWLEQVGDKAYLRWKGVEWWEDGYENLWQEPQTEEYKTTAAPIADSDSPTEGGDAASSPINTTNRQTSVKEQVIYLTADSENEISELVEGETYIIGGICDHNRYKNLCLNKATQQGIRTARLPIGKYMAQLPTRKVLTVNQVFDILIRWLEERDWEKALFDVMPKRKFRDGPKKGTSENGEEQDIDENEASDDPEVES